MLHFLKEFKKNKKENICIGFQKHSQTIVKKKKLNKSYRRAAEIKVIKDCFSWS